MSDDAAKKERMAQAAKRALAEAEERRESADKPQRPKELGGRNGPEPTRFGDWEKDGLTSDF
ncbi:MAG: DUF1674 domain-containing protein [Pseudomonadota bacterium]